MKIIEYFLQITKIPHCSYNSEKLKQFLVDFSKNRGYSVFVDDAGNILAKSKTPSISLQAHYDMVCVGDAPNIRVTTKNNKMSAQNSSLGADNGIAVSMMMSLMDERADCEFLFTADEEVGLVGAKALNFPLSSKYMLNLDSEDEAEVYIGCAGGVDIYAQKSYKLKESDDDFYEIEISNLPGGHSGVDIDKNIPNAIKVFADFCKDKNIKIAKLKAGERINSIAANLKAVVSSSEMLQSSGFVKIKPLEKKYLVIEDSSQLLNLLSEFTHGVIEFDKELNIPYISANLALVKLKNNEFTIEVSARAMDDNGLFKIEKEIKEFFDKYGYKTKSADKYPAWKPETNEFSKLVYQEMKKNFNKCEYRAIHAGLECAVISSIYPNIKIASIGPNIKFPHSVNEEVDLVSVAKIYEVLKRVINEVKCV